MDDCSYYIKNRKQDMNQIPLFFNEKDMDSPVKPENDSFYF